MILSIFSYVYWPSVCLLWRNVCLGLRTIFFLIMSCTNSLYILEINLLSVVSFAIIFSHSEVCLLSLFIVAFAVQKLLREEWDEGSGGMLESEGIYVSLWLICIVLWQKLVFPGGSDSKYSTCNVGDLGLIPGLGRSPGGGHGNPLQYSCLGIPMDRGAWWATVHGVTKSRTLLSFKHSTWQKSTQLCKFFKF